MCVWITRATNKPRNTTEPLCHLKPNKKPNYKSVSMLNADEDQYIWGMTLDYVLQAANRFNPTIVKTRHYSHCVCNNKPFNVTRQPSTTADRKNGFQFIIHLEKKKNSPTKFLQWSCSTTLWTTSCLPAQFVVVYPFLAENVTAYK